ncbi:multidrug resistance-associated ABC transporter [Mycena haematopus]|nr:multidrug resistance-associated ABC transporter [Mycena haematopus]
MNLCGDSDASDLANPCIRGSWAALAPSVLVLAISVSWVKLPLPKPVRRVVGQLKGLLAQYLSLREAEGLILADERNLPQAQLEVLADNAVPLWRTVVFVFIGLLECLAWLASGAFLLVTGYPRWEGIQQFLIASTWLYTVVRPILWPTATPPYDVLTLYIVHIAGGTLQLGGYIFLHNVWGAPLPGSLVLAGLSVNLAALIGLVVVVMGMPLELPSEFVEKDSIGSSVSPEDYTSLWGWVTFNWVKPLLKRGRNATLNEKDVWDLSPTFQSRPLFIKFSTLPQKKLLARMWAASSFDIIADFILTPIGILLYYAVPIFLKRVLDALDTSDQLAKNKGKAYVYATLMFMCSICKAQVKAQHLWFIRRACTRLRSELMAAIYDKTLKRRDFSGAIDQKNGNANAADTGKIINLMAFDADRISSAVLSLYDTPMEIIIASVLLYQLLGISAFAGVVALLLLGWPLNSYLSRRSFRIHKGVLKAKDARMGVLTELISSVKFIKFFGWEQRWIDRALEAREEEMHWMTKARMNAVGLGSLWITAPILISIVSFSTYVMLGNQLTIGTAFTAIALFGMIRRPLEDLPGFVMVLIQTRVSLNRVSIYLDEAEVSEQVSTLKKDRSGSASIESEDDRLGFENASFKWNEVEQALDANQRKDENGKRVPSETNSIHAAEHDTETVADHRFELKDLSVVFPEGKLTVVTGPTASGKTALLMAALGEMISLPGGRLIMAKNTNKIDAHGNMHAISYAAQTPWLQHRSIKDNILFGFPFDEARYNEVVECCALRTDFEILEDGDLTEIGDNGISLSGGQKARVALARAVYARTRYVLLDDPLSAVDSHTSRTLYEKCIRGPLLANRTVVLVTHHVQLVLPGAHYLVRMVDGRINKQGTVNELRAQGVLDHIAHDAAAEIKKEQLAVAKEPDAKLEGAKQPKKPRKLVEDEHREIGAVEWRIYSSYLKASSYTIWVLLILTIVLLQLLSVAEKLWIKTWGEAYTDNDKLSVLYGTDSSLPMDRGIRMDAQISRSSTFNLHLSTIEFLNIDWPSAAKHPLFYVGIYAAIGSAAALVNILMFVLQLTGALRASRTLFKALLETVVHATFRFHDTTPQGRMLNRFGRDFETIDTSLARSMRQVTSFLGGFVADLLTVTVVFPVFLIPASFIGWFYYTFAAEYLNTGRDLRRMESNSRSYIVSDFGELLNGVVTVRAFAAEKRFLDNLHKRIDLPTNMWYTFWMLNRWLVLNFDFLGSLIVLFTSLFSIYFLVDNAGLAGLAITSALSFTVSVFWACRFSISLELDLNAVERVVEYLGLPQEPPAIIESNRPPAYWPSSTKNDSLIVAQNLTIKYAPELPAVLQDISFHLKAGERIGLIGRTGSGKSTLAMSILRFTDPSSGRILIDGLDISKIGVEDLRSRLTFIPQDATLFSGTLRQNVDPFNEHDDAACLDVLHRVQMISRSNHASQSTSRAHSNTPSPDPSRPPSVAEIEREGTVDSLSTAVTDSKTTVSLDTQVSAGGANFSQGQKQLIAMARALLRRNSIVILDEATSSVDFETDVKIQTTIREEFTGSLLLTVAHRLNTIIDYDRLLVLDKGKLVEFDTPLRLIEKDGGIFRGMCLKSGHFAELEVSARAKAEQSR